MEEQEKTAAVVQYTGTAVAGKRKCIKCGRLKNEKRDFYQTRDHVYLDLCKDCLTLHVNNFQPDTFVWILQKLDLPWIPSEWNTLRDREYAKDHSKVGGSAVLGKYVGKMRMNQFKSYAWADSEALQEAFGIKEEEAAQLDAELAEQIKQQYETGEISEAEYKTLVETKAQYEEDLKHMTTVEEAIGENNLYNEADFLDEQELPDPAAELTQDDKIYLAMKWGRLYKPAEWIEMETKYNEMMESFDIQDSDTKSTLILICKTLHKMNQSLDDGDIDGYQKLARVYESMRKSANFTAAQNKEDRGKDIDCIGQFILLCEREEGFIPRFLPDAPQDKVDQTLLDMNNYTASLIKNDLGIGDMIEQHLKKMEILQEMDNSDRDDNHVLSDKEIAEYHEYLDGSYDIDVLTQGGSLEDDILGDEM